MKFSSVFSFVLVSVALGTVGCTPAVAPEEAPATADLVDEVATEDPVDDEPVDEPVDDEPVDDEPVDETPPFVGTWNAIELVKSFNGSVFYDYPAVQSELTLTLTILDDLSADFFQDLPTSDTSMTGTATMGATSADLTLDLLGEVVYNSGTTNATLGDFTCSVDMDTMTCTGFNDEDGDILDADIVLERI